MNNAWPFVAGSDSARAGPVRSLLARFTIRVTTSSRAAVARPTSDAGSGGGLEGRIELPIHMSNDRTKNRHRVCQRSTRGPNRNCQDLVNAVAADLPGCLAGDQTLAALVATRRLTIQPDRMGPVVGQRLPALDDRVDETVSLRVRRRHPAIAIEVALDPLERLPGVAREQLEHLRAH